MLNKYTNHRQCLDEHRGTLIFCIAKVALQSAIIYTKYRGECHERSAFRDLRAILEGGSSRIVREIS